MSEPPAIVPPGMSSRTTAPTKSGEEAMRRFSVADLEGLDVAKMKCIGCRYCEYACPYGVRVYNEEQHVIEKCTLCSHLTSDGSGLPACVEICTTGARFFGDLDDPNSAVSKELGKYPAESIHTLPDTAGTHPSTRYILSPSIAKWKELS